MAYKDTQLREDVVVILDKHFNLGSLAKAAGGSKPAADATGRNSKDKSNHAFNFDEQSRRAAEVIRAAGWVPLASHTFQLLISCTARVP